VLILLTNDDGIQSHGLQALAEQVDKLGEVVVVAPDRERSAIGHALTLHAPLRAQEYRHNWWAIDGTPTDCVSLGIHGLVKSQPDLVISGINRGANLGDDITYSGTVAAAMEATLMGVPAFAISLDAPDFSPEGFAWAARIAVEVAQTIKEHALPADTFLNVNVPSGRPKGLQLTRQGKRVYEGGSVVCNSDPRGNDYYWIGAGELCFQNLEGTDFNAIQAGQVSVTPLHLDLTNYAALDRLRQWHLEQLPFAAEGKGNE